MDGWELMILPENAHQFCRQQKWKSTQEYQFGMSRLPIPCNSAESLFPVAFEAKRFTMGRISAGLS